MPGEPKFTNLAVEQETKRKIVLLAAVRNERIHELVARLANAEWKAAEQAGVVKKAMLGAQAAS